MNIDYIKLQKIDWDTEFRIEFRSEEMMVITISELVIDGVKYQDSKLNCLNPFDEWACYWDDNSEKWEDHADIGSPIGDRITVFNAKKAGGFRQLSFGGNHRRGFARWGFYCDQIEFIKGYFAR